MDISNNKPVGKIEPIKAVEPVEPRHFRGQAEGLQEDRITLSDQARLIESARQKVKAMETIDEEKVAEIKARLEAGTYRIDSRQLATKILRESFIHHLQK